MSSKGNTDGGARPNGASRDGSESSERAPRLICTACQRPIENETPSEWLGEPVHFECGAELRCGVSIGPE